MSHKISVIGTGYVGLVSGTCFAESGNDVMCIDVDVNKVEKLRQGIMPIYEPGLEHLLERNIKNGRLKFSTVLSDALEGRSVIFLCLPTPPGEDGSADLHYVLDVAEQMAQHLKENADTRRLVVVNKSTVPVGTTRRVQEVFDSIFPECQVSVVSNPEFLREGFAVFDFMNPDRVVIGTSHAWAAEIVSDLYQPLMHEGNPIYVMDAYSSELTKYAANSFLAMKITFMNELAAYCEHVGADIENIRLGIGADPRIGRHFLLAGLGYGGSCFPKDVKALLYSTGEAGHKLGIMSAVKAANDMQVDRFIGKITRTLPITEDPLVIAVWGLAFKPNTDDTRESQAFKVVQGLLDAGYRVRAYDPEALEHAKRTFGSAVEFCLSAYECLEHADALVVATEWPEFQSVDFDRVKSLLRRPYIYDGRNIYDPHVMREHGFTHFPVGRPQPNFGG